MYYKCSATVNLRCIISASSEADASEKAENEFKRILNNMKDSGIDPKYIKVELFDFFNKRIIISDGGPLSGQY